MSSPLATAAQDELVRAAFDVMRHAYAPYSQFRVGAALASESGAGFQGCNVENSSFPAGICAERAALSAAVAAGHRRFTLLAVATEATAPTPPCGLCRQALVEFAPQLEIISATLDGQRARWRLSDLLPAPFTPDSLTHA